MLKKVFYASLLAVALCCMACAAKQPSINDFNGSWVVDLGASHAINPTLGERVELPKFMSQITMTIDVEQKQLIIAHAEETEPMIMVMTVVEHSPNKLLVDVGDEVDTNRVLLQLDKGKLIFQIPDDSTKRDDFVFVPAAVK